MSRKKGDKHSRKPAAVNKGKRMTKKQRKLLSKLAKERFANGATTWNKGKHTGQRTWNKGIKGVMVGWWKGKQLTKKHRQNQSKAHTGRHLSEETKQKIRDAMKEYWSRRKEEK
jgi:hypothetical protein